MSTEIARRSESHHIQEFGDGKPTPRISRKGALSSVAVHQFPFFLYRKIHQNYKTDRDIITNLTLSCEKKHVYLTLVATRRHENEEEKTGTEDRGTHPTRRSREVPALNAQELSVVDFLSSIAKTPRQNRAPRLPELSGSIMLLKTADRLWTSGILAVSSTKRKVLPTTPGPTSSVNTPHSLKVDVLIMFR
jgi:hypothetical protein